MFCSKCGTLIDDSDNYCSACGAKAVIDKERGDTTETLTQIESVAPNPSPNCAEPLIVHGYCPTCEKEVEYSMSGSSAYCTVCGRTKNAAQSTIEVHKRTERDRKLMWVWIALGALLFIVATIVNPEVTGRGIVKGLMQGIVILIFIIPLYWFFGRKKKRDQDDRQQ
jgi:hypothetical protein